MVEYKGVMPDKSLQYIDSVKEKMSRMSPRDIADRTASLVKTHDDWRRNHCLNLNPSENAISPGAQRLLDSDMATRVTEGFVGAKHYPPERMNVYIDEIEAMLVNEVKQMFDCKYVEYRPLNNTMANAVVFFSLTKPGETIMSQSMRGGANVSYHSSAVPGIRGLKVVDMAPTMDFRIDLEHLEKTAREVKPSWLVVGGGKILFPYNLKVIREIADEVGARIMYDAAHLGPLIAYDLWQKPLKEGADVMTTGTHKLMGGPIGGLILTDDEELARKIMAIVHPPFMQTRDQNKYASAVWALAEMMEYGEAYAKQIQANSRTLGAELDKLGFNVMGKDNGYSMSHQVLVNIRGCGFGDIEKRFHDSNILLPVTTIMGDELAGTRSGLRISIQEATRQGMKEQEMRQVAAYIRRVADGKGGDSLRAEIEEFVEPYRELKYCFPI